MKGKLRILLVLLVLLCLSVVYAVWMSPRQEEISVRKVAVQPRQEAAAAPAGDLPKLQLELLDTEPQAYPGAERDIFQFKSLRRTGPVKKASPPKKILRPPVAEQPETAVPPQVNRELSRFTLLGFVETTAGKTVFLSSGGETFIARTGQSFGRDQEFLVEHIHGNQLVVSRNGTDALIEVALVENEPLAVSSRPATVRRLPEPLSGKATDQVPQETVEETDVEGGTLDDQGTDHADQAHGEGNGG